MIGELLMIDKEERQSRRSHVDPVLRAAVIPDID